MTTTLNASSVLVSDDHSRVVLSTNSTAIYLIWSTFWTLTSPNGLRRETGRTETIVVSYMQENIINLLLRALSGQQKQIEEM